MISTQSLSYSTGSRLTANQVQSNFQYAACQLGLIDLDDVISAPTDWKAYATATFTRQHHNNSQIVQHPFTNSSRPLPSKGQQTQSRQRSCDDVQSPQSKKSRHPQHACTHSTLRSEPSSPPTVDAPTLDLSPPPILTMLSCNVPRPPPPSPLLSTTDYLDKSASLGPYDSSTDNSGTESSLFSFDYSPATSSDKLKEAYTDGIGGVQAKEYVLETDWVTELQVNDNDLALATVINSVEQDLLMTFLCFAS